MSVCIHQLLRLLWLSSSVTVVQDLDGKTESAFKRWRLSGYFLSLFQRWLRRSAG